MNIVFMGTPDFAVKSLEKLMEYHNVVAVVSQPDKPKGRGKKLANTPVKEFYINSGGDINNIYQPEKIKDAEIVEVLKSLNADLFVVVAYGQILSQEVLDIPKYGCINVHGSLLPKYRGAGPIQWSIINGEEKTGVTIMYMEKGLDSGDMILKSEILIEEDETYGTLHDKMSVVGAEALIKAVDLIEKGEDNAEPQNHELSTYAPMITKQTGCINWSDTTKNIINLVRGLNPIPMAYTNYSDSDGNSNVFKICDVQETKEYANAKGEAGEIIDIVKQGFIVKTSDSAILVKELQAKGKKRMLCGDYLRGNSIQKNVILN